MARSSARLVLVSPAKARRVDSAITLSSVLFRGSGKACSCAPPCLRATERSFNRDSVASDRQRRFRLTISVSSSLWVIRSCPLLNVQLPSAARYRGCFRCGRAWFSHQPARHESSGSINDYEVARLHRAPCLQNLRLVQALASRISRSISSELA